MGRQLELFAAAKRRRRGAKRGRKPRADRVGFVPHVVRPEHDGRHPVHVTMHRVANAPSLRAQLVYAAIVRLLTELKSRGIRVVLHSVQPEHLHLMVESHDKKTLSRQMQHLFSKIARAVNRVARRRGSLFRDRHYRRDLRTPRETRRAIVYVLFNSRKHASSFRSMDVHSSMPWFGSWDPECAPDPKQLVPLGPTAPVSEPRTWLAACGWRRAGGRIRFDEHPAR
jgi:putative transposase